ncbi:hypothetical protein RRG08_048598 [Elysia crispata]|uniref:Uncharacterized protein n=1 Tax=Elysia crispata TaxID=231223 RepID=A0AAE1DWN1_9GAST|nr:hypothetical protein RRG08_048598 [Elysia crispata]
MSAHSELFFRKNKGFGMRPKDDRRRQPCPSKVTRSSSQICRTDTEKCCRLVADNGARLRRNHSLTQANQDFSPNEYEHYNIVVVQQRSHLGQIFRRFLGHSLTSSKVWNWHKHGNKAELYPGSHTES